MGLPVPLTSSPESCVPHPYRPGTLDKYPAAPHLATTGKRRAVDQAPAQRALPADHHLSHLGRGHGDDDVNEMADATSCTPPTPTRTRTHHTSPTHPPSPTGHQVYFVLQLPPAAAARHPQPAHTAARRRRRQRQRQRLFDPDLDLDLDLALALDLDLALDLALIITLSLPPPLPAPSLRFEPTPSSIPRRPLIKVATRVVLRRHSISGIGGGQRQRGRVDCLLPVSECPSHAVKPWRQPQRIGW